MLGLLVLGGKTQAGEAVNSQRSEEGHLLQGAWKLLRGAALGSQGDSRARQGRDWSGVGGQHYWGPSGAIWGWDLQWGKADREGRPW